MADIQATQSDFSYVGNPTTTNLVASQADTVAVFNLPSAAMEATQGEMALITVSDGVPMEVSQLDMVAIFRGRVDDPSVRAWTFTLDGHDFYVLHLGSDETLVYDLSTEQWYLWGSQDNAYWSAFTGTNWFGGNNFAASTGSNVIVGSDSNGALFFLDPDKSLDDSPSTGREPVSFNRRVTGQLMSRGYDSTRVFEVQLLGSLGQTDGISDLEVELLYSDDRGDSYVSAGAITTQDDNYDIRASWRSLGSFRSPGRLFRIEDDGALKRIDSLTVSTNNDPE